MASELQVVSNQVPAQIEELVNFVKVGREKLTAVRAEIRAIDKLGLEDEKRQAVLEQARTLGEQLLDAEVRLGAIMATLPEAPGKRTDLETPEDSDVQMSKKEILKEAGFSVKTAQRYEMLAAHPDVVAQIKAEARNKGAVVSRTAVLRAIANKDEKKYDKEHLSLSDYEMEKVEYLLEKFTTLPEDTDIPLEEQPWEGNILLIPPMSDIEPYAIQLRERFEFISEAIVVVPIDVTAWWFSDLASMSNAVFYRNYISVKAMDSEDEVNTKDSYAFFYIGKNAGDFLDTYKSNGWGHTINKVVTGTVPKRLKK